MQLEWLDEQQSTILCVLGENDRLGYLLGPITVNIPADPNNRDYQAIKAQGLTITPFVPLPKEFPSLSRRQFFQIAAMMGLITQDEALAAVQHGTIPAQLDGFINALPTGQQFAARMLISGASEFERHHELTKAFAHYLGMSDEQLDELWRQGATL